MGKKLNFFPLNVNSAVIYHFLCKQRQNVFTPNKHFSKKKQQIQLQAQKDTDGSTKHRS